MRDQRTVLGVDGGNSKTFAVVSDAGGRLLGFARGSGSNHEGIGFEAAERILRDVAGRALRDAKITRPVDAAFWALAGADTGSDFDRLGTIVKRVGVAGSNTVENDLSAALGAGLTRGWGVGVVCGAGFSSGGIAPDGRRLQFPSLGAITGDWGGGQTIGLEVLRLAHRTYDGRGRASRLADRVPPLLGMASFDELPERVRSEDLDWSAVRDDLPPLLFAAADEGDETARALVRRVGEEVGVTAATLIRRLGVEALDVEVVVAGSVFHGESPLLLEAIERRVREAAPRARIVRPAFHPVVGAVFQALRGLGIEVDEQVRQKALETLPQELQGEQGQTPHQTSKGTGAWETERKERDKRSSSNGS
jgi:N-acetylglucosamine kinase-like BadF-type ATPase